MSFHHKINAETIRLIIHSSINGLLIGAGICYTIQSEKYIHIPLVILFPSVYTGYHSYKNKDKILEWIRK